MNVTTDAIDSVNSLPLPTTPPTLLPPPCPRPVVKAGHPAPVVGYVEETDFEGLPIFGLPRNVRDFIKEMERVYRCPREFISSAVLFAAASAVGNRVQLRTGIYVNSPTLWFVVVAPSGSNKTTPVKRVLNPLTQINKELNNLYVADLMEWKKNGGLKSGFDAPKCQQIAIDDFTDEALIKVLHHNRHGVMCYKPEIGGFFSDRKRYSSTGGSLDRLINLYDGAPIIYNRKTDDDVLIIENSFFNLMGDIQPAMLRSAFGDSSFIHSGLNQRFLFCYCPTMEYPDLMFSTVNEEMISMWEELITNMFRDSSQGQGIILEMSEEAFGIYREYYNELQYKKEVASSDYQRSIYSKLQIQVLRIALTAHLIDCYTRSTQPLWDDDNMRLLSPRVMEYAVACMEYFERCALQVLDKIEGEGKELLTMAESIKNINRCRKIVNQKAFAQGIGVTQGYISKLLRQID